MVKCLDQLNNALVLKQQIRWSPTADATMDTNKSKCYNSFRNALGNIIADDNQKPEMIHEVKCLLQEMSKKENVITSGFGQPC